MTTADKIRLGPESPFPDSKLFGWFPRLFSDRFCRWFGMSAWACEVAVVGGVLAITIAGIAVCGALNWPSFPLVPSIALLWGSACVLVLKRGLGIDLLLHRNEVRAKWQEFMNTLEISGRNQAAFFEGYDRGQKVVDGFDRIAD